MQYIFLSPPHQKVIHPRIKMPLWTAVMGGTTVKFLQQGIAKTVLEMIFLFWPSWASSTYITPSWMKSENMPSYLCFLLTYPSKAFYLASCPPPSSSLPIAPNPRDKLSHDSLKDIGTKFLASVSIFSNKIGYSPQLL